MKTNYPIEVRLERQPHRTAIQRLRQAIRCAQQAGQSQGKRPGEDRSEEEGNETLSRPVCPSFNPTTGAGSDD